MKQFLWIVGGLGAALVAGAGILADRAAEGKDFLLTAPEAQVIHRFAGETGFLDLVGSLR